MNTPEIVVKTEEDFEYLANYTGDDGDTQNSQSSQSGMHLDTMRQQHAGMSSTIQHDSHFDNDDVKLMSLLREFDLEILYTNLKLNDITFRSLMYLTVDDINTAIRHLGYRAEFREKLFVWRKEKLSIADKDYAQTNANQQTITPTNMANKKTPTSIVAPAISVQSLQQNHTANTLNHNSNNAAIATTSSNMTTAATTHAQTVTPTTSTTTGSATIIKRSHSELTQAEDFLSLLPGMSVATTSVSNNMPAVVLEPSTFKFMPQTAKSPKLHAMATLNTVPTATTTATMTTTRASTKMTNLLGSGVVADGSNASSSSLTTNVGGASFNQNSSSSSNARGLRPSVSYAPKGLLIMKCEKVDISQVLQNSNIGQRIRQAYDKNGFLENHQRNEVVRLIVAEVMRQGETLCPKDLRAILDDILTVFPNEKAAADYYFIYRGGKGNPLGRLYQRYSNENVKRRRMIRISDDDDCSNFDVEMPQQITNNNTNTTTNSNSNSLIYDDDTMSNHTQDLPGNVPRVDEMTALALKQLLTTDHFSWEEVCDKWIQTWALRRKELQQSGLAELLSNWSKLADPRAAELFKIDFRHVYPNKENLLVGKWDEYIARVTPQFDKKMNHEELKTVYKNYRMGMASKDEKDYIFACGLVAFLPSNSRFKDHYGKLTIRPNLLDSLDSFVMRLPSLDAYETRLDWYNRKYGAVNRSTHPFMVVIMPTDCTISKIYVALESHFYCMQSFLQALDLCYKIYHTCDLKYPTMCENIWTFIQRYFYDMTVPWEARNSNLVSLIVSLTMQN